MMTPLVVTVTITRGDNTVMQITALASQECLAWARSEEGILDHTGKTLVGVYTTCLYKEQ
jgi:isopentenyl phosphate kinase